MIFEPRQQQPGRTSSGGQSSKSRDLSRNRPGFDHRRPNSPGAVAWNEESARTLFGENEPAAEQSSEKRNRDVRMSRFPSAPNKNQHSKQACCHRRRLQSTFGEERGNKRGSGQRESDLPRNFGLTKVQQSTTQLFFSVEQRRR